MVDIVQGDLFEADVAALVNPVHCAGVMSRGLALQFRTRFPENAKRYKDACEAGRLSPGDVLVHDRGGLFDAERPRYLLNVATKDHWTDASRPAHIEASVEGVVEQVTTRGLSSLAVPALGCGGGGLDWSTVRRVNDAYGDRNLFCSCPPTDAYEAEDEEDLEAALQE